MAWSVRILGGAAPETWRVEHFPADADEQDADEMPKDTSETAAEDAADIEPVQAEGDEEDPEAKATRREGLN